jgi:excisionase family DNA binding protein
MLPEMLTATEVAEWLRMSEATVRRLADSGDIPCVRVGKQFSFPRPLLEEWVQSGI